MAPIGQKVLSSAASPDRLKLSERQRYALQNPSDRSTGRRHRLAPYCSRIDGRWSSVLVVGRYAGTPWVWVAHVARLSDRRALPLPVADWRPQWRDEAQGRLEELLAGVGASEYELQAHYRRVGVDPSSLLYYARWRVLTPNELRIVYGGALECRT